MKTIKVVAVHPNEALAPVPRQRTWLRLATVSLLAGACVALLSARTWSAADANRPIVLVGSTLTDPFWGAFKKGVDDAAHDLRVKADYIPVTIAGPDLATALQTAIASKPIGIAYGDWFPKAEDPLVAEAEKSGIPVVAVNAAPVRWRSTGAMALVGQNDYEAGVLGGQLLLKQGVKHALCVDQNAGAANLVQRCNGLTDAFRKAGAMTSVLNIPNAEAFNPGEVTQAIQGTLSSDARIDGIFTLGSPIAIDAVRAVQQQGAAEKIKIGSVDLSTAVLNAINGGKIVFTIDQQPYLQGYYAVLMLAQNAKYGMHPVGQVATGPFVIDKSNVARVLQVNREYPGIRGAL